MKKMITGLSIFIVVITSFFLFNMSEFASALKATQSNGQEKEMEHGALHVRSPEERAQHLERLRAQVRNNLTKDLTPHEAKDVLIDYLLNSFADIFQGLANEVGNAIELTAHGDENIKRAANIIRKMPQAAADAGFIVWRLIGEIINKQYLAELQKIRTPIDCLFATKGNRQTLDKCADYRTLKQALFGVLDQARTVLLPFAKAMILGTQYGDRMIKGLLPMGVSIIEPSLEKNMNEVTTVVNTLLNLSEQLKTLT